MSSTLPPFGPVTLPQAGDDAATLGADAATEGTAIDRTIGDEMPRMVGRHRIVGRLGAGGMGIVYAAHDPELDRRIAIKLIHGERVGSDSEASGRARLLREAQAMARLSDPNVIQVYDVGLHEGQVYVAMELVEGGTLEHWLATPRAWREIIATFAQAGRGLAAAHAAGLVHRDFKPANVLVGSDGKVRVVDFGLARAAGLMDDTRGDTKLEEGAISVEHAITRTGALVGTPAYMSAEQFGGQPPDARSDQFSFCVALWQALYGQRPFAGLHPTELAFAVTHGEIRPPPREADVPVFLERALRRGLACDPADRFASMLDLLHAIERDPARRRRRLLAAITFAFVLGGGSLTAGLLLARGVAVRTTETPPCRGAEAQLLGIWDDTRRAAVRRSLIESPVSYAAPTWAVVAPLLDARASEWIAMRTDACEATHVRNEQSPQLLDLRIACLDTRKAELAAAVDRIASGDPDVLANAVRIVDGLRPLAACADTQRLVARVPVPDDGATAAQVERLRDALGSISVQIDAARYRDALERANAIAIEADALGWAPLRADARLQAGRGHRGLGDFARAQTSLADAYWLAAEAGDDETAGRAASELVIVAGIDLAQPEAGRTWWRHARVALGRADQIDDPILVHHDAELMLAQGKFTDAIAALEGLVARIESDRGAEHRDLVAPLLTLAHAHREASTYAAARQALTRAEHIVEATYGAEHPLRARVLNAHGDLDRVLDDHASARARLEQALALLDKSFGPQHPDTIETQLLLARALGRQGEGAQALAVAQTALVRCEAAFLPGHPRIADALLVLGWIHVARQELDEGEAAYTRAQAIAREHDEGGLRHARTIEGLALVAYYRGDLDASMAGHTRALEMLRKTVGDDHPEVADQHAHLANVAFLSDRYDDTIAGFREALAIRRRRYGPNHLHTAHAYRSLAGGLDWSGRLDEALPQLRDALVAHEAARGPDHTEVGTVCAELGRLQERRGDLREAQAYYERARAIWEASSDDEDLGYVLSGLSRLASMRGDDEEAIALAEAAIREHEARVTMPTFRAHADVALARALWRRDRARARRLIAGARTQYEAAGRYAARDLAELDAWLATAG